LKSAVFTSLYVQAAAPYHIQSASLLVESYTKTIGKSNMLLSKGPVPLGNCPLTWAHDLSLDFAAWQTIVRCVAFYHSLLSEQSFSIGLPYGHPNPYPSRTPLSPHMKHSVDPSTPSLHWTIRHPPKINRPPPAHQQSQRT